MKMIDYNDRDEQEMFMEQLKDNYQNPVNVGKIENYTFLKLHKNPSCGDMFEIFVKLNKDKTIIEDVKYTGNGCAISTASMSIFSQKLIGMNFIDAKELTDKDMYELLGVRISIGRINCAMISINAFKAGVEEFENTLETDSVDKVLDQEISKKFLSHNEQNSSQIVSKKNSLK